MTQALLRGAAWGTLPPLALAAVIACLTGDYLAVIGAATLINLAARTIRRTRTHHAQ